MSKLRNVSSSRWHNDSESAQRAAKEYLKFIMNNLHFLKKVKNSEKYISAAKSLNQQTSLFTPKQLSYIDVIYEKVMKGAGYPSFSATYKHKRKFI